MKPAYIMSQFEPVDMLGGEGNLTSGGPSVVDSLSPSSFIHIPSMRASMPGVVFTRCSTSKSGSWSTTDKAAVLGCGHTQILPALCTKHPFSLAPNENTHCGLPERPQLRRNENPGMSSSARLAHCHVQNKQKMACNA